MQIPQAQELAHTLMAQYGLNTWRFLFDQSVRRFGCCNHSKQQISLSAKLTKLNDEAVVRDTILHEIAHALAPVTAGHNRQWRQIALSIGCNGQRAYSHQDVVTPEKKYTGVCPNCQRVIKRHRRSGIACGKCCRLHNGGRFSEQYKFVWN